MQTLDHFGTEDVTGRYPYSQRHDGISFGTRSDKFFLSGTKGLINFGPQNG
jgi:hypothetical protein